MRPLATLMAATALAGCATPPAGDRADPNAAQPATARCDATKARRLIGRAATPAAIDLARRQSEAASVRTIAPGTMVTMDYRPDRLSITTDARNMMTAIRCG